MDGHRQPDERAVNIHRALGMNSALPTTAFLAACCWLASD